MKVIKAASKLDSQRRVPRSQTDATLQVASRPGRVACPVRGRRRVMVYPEGVRMQPQYLVEMDQRLPRSERFGLDP